MNRKNKRIGFTTSLPVEVIVATGHIPVDLNNLFINGDAQQKISSAEHAGFPRNVCSWIKGIYTAALEADLLVVIAFGQKIGQEVIKLQKHEAINVHASLLPKYRGAAPIHWAIVNGETETGVSIITLAEKMDAGLVLGQGKIPILPDDTIESVHDKLSDLAVPVLMRTIEEFAQDSVTYVEQDEAKVTYAPKLKRKDGYINWDDAASQINNLVRGLWPWPAAETVYVCSRTGKHWRVGIAKAQVVDRPHKKGDVTGTLDKNLNVICGDGALQILELKPAGSRLMDFESYINGHQCEPGDLFVSADKAMNGIL